MTTMTNAGNVVPTTEPDLDVMPVMRNMSSRTASQPCTCVNCTFGRDVFRAKHNLAGDLASYMFGHSVSTEVAAHVLTTLVFHGVVQVFKGRIPHDERPTEGPFDPRSEDVQHALVQAFETARAHDCIRLHPEEGALDRYPLRADQAKEENTYTFKWRIMPQEPFEPEDVVSFLNEVTDRAFAIARPYLAAKELRHRFAAPGDHRYFVPLTYDPDQEDIRTPDFALLPIQAFSGPGFETVDKRYFNYSAVRLVGESNDDLSAGLDEMQRYAQGLKYAQPWVYCVLSLTVSLCQDLVVFSRVDPSDWEHVSLMLWDGRGCIEFIRILLGLALADDIDLGQNPEVRLISAERTFEIDLQAGEVSSNADSQVDASSVDDTASTKFKSSVCDVVPATTCQNAVEKMDHSQIESEADGEEDPRSKKYKFVDVI